MRLLSLRLTAIVSIYSLLIGPPLTVTADDCNTNGIEDVADISSGTSADCNTTGVPDECETIEVLTYSVTDPADVPIPNESTVYAMMEVEAPGPITDVNVGVDIQHTFDPDLNVSVGHGGVSVELFAGVGSDGNGDNFTGTVLDEQAINVIGSTGYDSAPFTGTYSPEGDLNAFTGLDGYGEWTLFITDVNDDDVLSGTGTLLSWTLYIQTAVENDCDDDGIPDECQDCNTNGTNDACGTGPISGYAVALDGVNDNVVIPFFAVTAPTSEITIELWQKAEAAGRATFGLAPDFVTNRILAHVPWSDGMVYWDYGDINGGGRLSYSPPESILDTWQHFAFVSSQSGNYMRIYRNGVLEAEKPGPGNFSQNAGSLRIGAMGTDSDYAFEGLIDEFRVWNVARTDTQIQDNMLKTLGGGEYGLVAYWRLDEGDGTTAADLAGQDEDGTLINGAGWALIEKDCNGNGIPDACDDGDCNTNDILDVCEVVTPEFGGFAPALTYAVGNTPISTAMGDIDLDGDTDLAVANRDSVPGTISLLLNNGDGSFADSVPLGTPWPYNGPYSVVIGDLDGDGAPDLAANRGTQAAVFPGNGDGTFSAYAVYDIGFSSTHLALGDLDSDGDLDITSANHGANSVSVLMNNDDGTYAPQVEYGVGSEPRTVAVGDLDGDGDLDLATANETGATVSVLLNNSDGTFASYVNHNVNNYAYFVAIDDLDSDGDADLSVAGWLSPVVTVMLNNGDATFSTPVAYPVGNAPLSVTIHDVDGDGDPDLATANFTDPATARVLLNNGDGTFGDPLVFAVDGVGSLFAAIGDLDGDAISDLAVTYQYTNSVAVLLNQTLVGAADCDTNGRPDACDVAGETASDCNTNAVPDACELAECVTITTVDPIMHEVTGGSPVVILGEGLPENVSVFVNGLPVGELMFVDSGKWLARVPANPAGAYDLVVTDPDSGEVLAVHPGAVMYEERKLPAPEDVSGILRMDGSVQLRWSNLIYHDSVKIKRGGEVIATLDGNAKEFVDIDPGEGNFKEYEIIGTKGDSDSRGAVATVPLVLEFDPCYSPYNFINEHHVRRPAGTKRLALYGSELNERQTWFHITTADSGNFEITLRAARLRTGGQLKARIRELQPPQEIVRDNITMGDMVVSAEGGILNSASTGPDLPAGEYILGFYVDGGDSDQVIFSLVTDASEKDQGDPYPCPPFPMATIRPLCGYGPVITGISVELPTIESNGHWRYSEFQAFNSEDPYAPPEFQPLSRILVATATDDGKIVEYDWDLGGGKHAKSKSNSVTHAFAQFGFYDVQLRVSDDSGRTDTSATTVALKPIGIPPAAGAPPGITHLSPPPSKGTFMPAIEPDVFNTYTVFVTPAMGDKILGVTMEMVDSAGNVYQPQSAVKALEGDADPATFWKGTFNMSDLPDEFFVNLHIVADQELGPNGEIEPEIELCKLPLYYALPFVETDVSYDAFAKEYNVVGTIGILHDSPITLFDVTVDNAIELGLTGRQRLRNKRWESSSLQGDARVELLDFDVFNESFEAHLPDSVEFTTCGTYEFCYMAEDLQLFSTSQEFPLIEDATLYTAPGVTIEGSLAIGFDVDVDADVLACVRYPEDPYAALDIQVDTNSSAWVTGELDADILYGLASATFQIKPSISMALPVTVGLELAPPGLDITADPCFMFDVEVQVETCGAWGLVCEEFGPYEVYHENFLCDGPPGPEDDPEIPPLQMPALATSTDGQIGLVVHVKNIAPPGAIDNELYFSVDTGSGLSIPAPLYTPSDEYNQMDPDVAFLSETQALAVWNQGRLTLAELAALTTDPDDLNHLAKHSDIFFARWTQAGGWEPPEALLDDASPRIPDGKPAIAAIPNQSAVWTAWVRSDDENMFDSVGAPILSGMSIYARKIDAGGPSGDPIKVSGGDEADPSVDIEPAIAWSPQGDTGCIVFVRDLDSDFNTSEDRVLMGSFFSSGAWGPALQITDPIELPGVLMPSIALSSDDDGMLTFTVRNRLADGTVAGEGNQDLVYTVELRDGAFQTPVQLRRHACSSGRPVFGRSPIVRYLDGENAVVTFRDFDGFGASGGDGELAISTIDFAQSTPKWTLVRDLTNDNVRDWEIAMATGPGEMVHTVRVNGAEELGTVCMANIAWVPDLKVDSVLLSDPHTQPGLPVRITTVLRNAGLRGTIDMPMPEPMLHIGLVENEVFTEIAAVPFSFNGIQVDDKIEISYTIIAPSATAHLRVIADPIGGELDMNNNSSDAMLGVMPPLNVACEPGASEGDTRPVMLTWTNGESYDAVLIYRDDRLSAKLTGSAQSYTDPAVTPGEHTWMVRGQMGLALSDLDVASCTAFLSLCPNPAGDMTGDGEVDGDDVQCFVECLIMGRRSPCGLCDCADTNGDGHVDEGDAAGLIDVLLQP